MHKSPSYQNTLAASTNPVGESLQPSLRSSARNQALEQSVPRKIKPPLHHQQPRTQSDNNAMTTINRTCWPDLPATCKHDATASRERRRRKRWVQKKSVRTLQDRINALSARYGRETGALVCRSFAERPCNEVYVVDGLVGEDGSMDDDVSVLSEMMSTDETNSCTESSWDVDFPSGGL